MRKSLIAAAIAFRMLGASVASAAVPVYTANITAQCTQYPNIAIRWGHPEYSSHEYMPRMTVTCGAPVTKTIQIKDAQSEFEVQTEGGIIQSYTIHVDVLRDGVDLSSIDLVHAGSPTLTDDDNGYGMYRTSGPNKYGEQNYRIAFDAGKTANVSIITTVTGDRSDAQMALRWGPIYTFKPGQTAPVTFRASGTSEFEIQTEGGENTTYDMRMWFDYGHGGTVKPSVEIKHAFTPTAVTVTTHAPCTPVGFTHTPGNIYGEMDVKVSIPALGGEVQTCN